MKSSSARDTSRQTPFTEMFLRFTSLTPSEVEPYIESITPERLGDDLNYFSGVVNKRAGYVIEFPHLVLNVPTLAISP